MGVVNLAVFASVLRLTKSRQLFQGKKCTPEKILATPTNHILLKLLETLHAFCDQFFFYCAREATPLLSHTSLLFTLLSCLLIGSNQFCFFTEHQTHTGSTQSV